MSDDSRYRQLLSENSRLRAVLAKYVAEDNTYEGGVWEERNAPWLGQKREAQALLERMLTCEEPFQAENPDV